MRLKNKFAIVAGAARGIGAVFAKGFGKEGAKVVIGDISDGKKIVDAIEKAGGKAPGAIQKILDCLGLPSKPPPISPAVLGRDSAECPN